MKARLKDTGEIIELAEEGIISHDGRRYCWHQVELLPEPVDEVQPSLPSNIDEAAEEYIKFKPRYDIQQELEEGEDPTEIDCFTIDAVIDAFKAGAELMAWQGVNLKCWIARDECSGDESNLYIGQQKPRRIPGTAPGFGMWSDYGEFMALPSDMFPELTYSDEPIEVELIIRKK